MFMLSFETDVYIEFQDVVGGLLVMGLFSA